LVVVVSLTRTLPLTTTTTIVTRDDGARALSLRGVASRNIGAILSENPLALILAWCDYATTQDGMGPGAVVEGIRSRQMPPTRPVSMLAAQAEYGRSIQAWLTKCFPELGPHPAAVAEVIRLHWRHGKGRLTRDEHGPAIRAAVAAWEEDR
jgi:hypothetical protein